LDAEFEASSVVGVAVLVESGSVHGCLDLEDEFVLSFWKELRNRFILKHSFSQTEKMCYNLNITI
jgi:hypothetical protein